MRIDRVHIIRLRVCAANRILAHSPTYHLLIIIVSRDCHTLTRARDPVKAKMVICKEAAALDAFLASTQDTLNA